LPIRFPSILFCPIHLTICDPFTEVPLNVFHFKHLKLITLLPDVNINLRLLVIGRDDIKSFAISPLASFNILIIMVSASIRGIFFFLHSSCFSSITWRTLSFFMSSSLLVTRSSIINSLKI
jgi:hypothetical protein